MNFNIRMAGLEDVGRLRAFLEKAGLSPDGVEENVDNFLVMENDSNDIIAALGIERVERAGLLRSLAIAASIDQAAILALFRNAFILAAKKELQSLYLVTNRKGSLQLFSLMGFEVIEKARLPEFMGISRHFTQSVEREDAVVMRISL